MNPSRNRRRGKDAERAIAGRLDGRRVGVLGGEDVVLMRLSDFEDFLGKTTRP
jgi:hypothetical protein